MIREIFQKQGLSVVLLFLGGFLATGCSETTTTVPEVVDHWKPWVAEKMLDDEQKQELIDRYVNYWYDSCYVQLEYTGDYTDDESADGQYAETNAYLVLTASTLMKVDLSSGDLGEQIRSSLQRVIDGSWYQSEYQTHLLAWNFHPSAADWWARNARKNTELCYRNVLKICRNISKLTASLAATVEVMDWAWDAEDTGDKFDVYRVIYLVNRSLYVQCVVMERNDGVAEIKVTSSSKHLLNL